MNQIFIDIKQAFYRTKTNIFTYKRTTQK